MSSRYFSQHPYFLFHSIFYKYINKFFIYIFYFIFVFYLFFIFYLYICLLDYLSPSLDCKLHKGRRTIIPQHLSQCLAYSRISASVGWMNDLQIVLYYKPSFSLSCFISIFFPKTKCFRQRTRDYTSSLFFPHALYQCFS